MSYFQSLRVNTFLGYISYINNTIFNHQIIAKTHTRRLCPEIVSFLKLYKKEAKGGGLLHIKINNFKIFNSNTHF